MNPTLTLISHRLCPYVQRAAIVLEEKGLVYTRRDIDLANKPDWFLAVSPMGRTPVLLVDDVPVFESTVICDYLDEVYAPRLHPVQPLDRARHRAWVEFASGMLNTIAAFYNAADEQVLAGQASALRSRLLQLEAQLGDGPWFAGAHFSVVDAAFGPVFRYFDLFDSLGDFRFFEDLPRVCAWRLALAERPSVRRAADPEYPGLLREFVRRRGSALSRRFVSN